MTTKDVIAAIVQVNADLSRIKQGDAASHDEFMKNLDEIEAKLNESLQHFAANLHQSMAYLRQQLGESATVKAQAIDAAVGGEKEAET